jgi:hypothetical protein
MTCTFHCSGCGSHFHSLEAFDLHRSGDHALARYCIDPVDCDRLAVATADGVCRLVRDVDEISPVTVYRSRRHAEDGDAVLRLRSSERPSGRARGGGDPSATAERQARALADGGS